MAFGFICGASSRPSAATRPSDWCGSRTSLRCSSADLLRPQYVTQAHEVPTTGPVSVRRRPFPPRRPGRGASYLPPGSPENTSSAADVAPPAPAHRRRARCRECRRTDSRARRPPRRRSLRGGPGRPRPSRGRVRFARREPIHRTPPRHGPAAGPAAGPASAPAAAAAPTIGARVPGPSARPGAERRRGGRRARRAEVDPDPRPGLRTRPAARSDLNRHRQRAAGRGGEGTRPLAAPLPRRRGVWLRDGSGLGSAASSG